MLYKGRTVLPLGIIGYQLKSPERYVLPLFELLVSRVLQSLYYRLLPLHLVTLWNLVVRPCCGRQHILESQEMEKSSWPWPGSSIVYWLASVLLEGAMHASGVEKQAYPTVNPVSCNSWSGKIGPTCAAGQGYFCRLSIYIDITKPQSDCKEQTFISYSSEVHNQGLGIQYLVRAYHLHHHKEEGAEG